MVFTCIYIVKIVATPSHDRVDTCYVYLYLLRPQFLQSAVHALRLMPWPTALPNADDLYAPLGEPDLGEAAAQARLLDADCTLRPRLLGLLLQSRDDSACWNQCG